MSPLEALLLGILQGITEFLPISSSGHLKLGEWLLGMNHLDQYIAFDLTCHVGTLLALFAVLYRDIWHVLTRDRKMLGMLMLGLLPLLPLYFFLKPIKALYGAPQYIGFFFLVTASLLFLGEALANRVKRPAKRSDALLIGVAQACAILPAVSRSGATMAAARSLGWDRTQAARFSFLLSIPTILGGLLIEGKELFETTGSAISPVVYGIGLVSAFVTGYFVLRGLFKLLKRMTLRPFAYYCTAVGLFTLIYMSMA